MNYRTPITDSDLHAYVDGQLNPERRAEVDAFLAENPEAAARVRYYREINQGLRSLYGSTTDESLPPFTLPSRRRYWSGRVAAAVAYVALGAVATWVLKPATMTLEHGLPEQLARPAVYAHRVFVPEVAHPVEVSAAQEQHLVKWLSRRLETPLKAPSLAAHGYALMGGRLLPADDGLAAQFMYQNPQGKRVTLYLRRGVEGNTSSSFTYRLTDQIGTFYWVEGSMGYALSGESNKDELFTLAHTVYQELSP